MPTATAPAPRTALFRGTCPGCHGPIAVGDAILWSPSTGATHTVCPAPEYLPDCPHCNPAPALAAPVTAPISVAPGTYTIVVPGEGRRTVRVQEPREVARRDGVLFVKYLTGSDNESAYTYCGFIDPRGAFHWSNNTSPAVRDGLLGTCLDYLFYADTDEQRDFGRTYGLESGNCYVCGRLLTVPSSIAMGIGPDCAGRQ